jgi:hypothetical protein
VQPSPGLGDHPAIPSLHLNILDPSIALHNTFSVLGEEDLWCDDKVGTRASDQIPAQMVVSAPLPPSCSVEDCAQLALALPQILDYLSLYGFVSDESFRPEKTLQHWQLCSAYCGWMKFLKYKFSAFFAFYLNTEIPVPPFPVRDHPSMLVGSTAGRFTRLVMHKDASQPFLDFTLSFATGVLYLKKCMPRSLPSELLAAREKTKKVLTTKQQIPVLPNCPSTFDDLLFQCRRTARDVFNVDGQVVKFTDRDLHRPFFPSIRANNSHSRGDLGTYGQLRDAGYYGPPPVPTEDELWDEDPSDIEKWYRDDVKTFEDLCAYSQAVEVDYDEEVRRYGDGEREYCDVNVESRPLRVKPSFRESVERRHREMYEAVRRDLSAVPESPVVKLVSLAESLKIRIISKGPGLSYWLLKPIQMFLSKLLGNHRCFALTRNTDLQFTTDHVNDVIGNVEGDIASLDYEGATDNFNPLVSEAIVRELSDMMKLDPFLTELFVTALIRHLIGQTPQEWGQLMGSIVSFVVLCIGNAAVCRHSLELSWNRTFTLSDAPLSINGDDGLTRGPPAFKRIWSQLSTLVGLKPSIGKVYFHSHYANINSTSFILRDGRFVHVPFVNMGLVCGLKRSSADPDDVSDVADSVGSHASSLGSRHHSLIRSCPPPLVQKVHSLYLRRHKDLLTSLYPVPLYVSEEFGGAGLCPVYSDTSFDYEDPYDGAGCVDNIRYAFGPSSIEQDIVTHLSLHPHPGLHRLPSAAPVAVRNIWTRALRSQYPAGLFDISEEDCGLLDISVPLIARHVTGLLSDPSRQFHRNQSVWKRLRRRFLRDTSASVHTQLSEFDSDWWSLHSVVTVRGPAFSLRGDSTSLGAGTCHSPSLELD